MNLFPDIYLHAFRKRKQLHSGAQLTIALILPPARQHPRHVATRLQDTIEPKEKHTATHPPNK